MARTYLKLVQDFVSEVGVAGGTGPVTLAIGQEQDGIRRVIQFIAEADRDICRSWPDWDFLWAEEDAETTPAQVSAGSTILAAPATPAREHVLDSFQILAGNSWRSITYMRWPEFRKRFRIGSTKTATTTPSFWTVRPDRSIELSAPIGDVFRYRYEFFQWNSGLENDDDVSLIPGDFDRAILVRAKIIFAERENAPEIMHGASAEFDDIITRLEANYLTGSAGGRHHEDGLVVRDV